MVAYMTVYADTTSTPRAQDAQFVEATRTRNAFDGNLEAVFFVQDRLRFLEDGLGGAEHCCMDFGVTRIDQDFISSEQVFVHPESGLDGELEEAWKGEFSVQISEAIPQYHAVERPRGDRGAGSSFHEHG